MLVVQGCCGLQDQEMEEKGCCLQVVDGESAGFACVCNYGFLNIGGPGKVSHQWVKVLCKWKPDAFCALLGGVAEPYKGWCPRDQLGDGSGVGGHGIEKCG